MDRPSSAYSEGTGGITARSNTRRPTQPQATPSSIASSDVPSPRPTSSQTFDVRSAYPASLPPHTSYYIGQEHPAANRQPAYENPAFSSLGQLVEQFLWKHRIRERLGNALENKDWQGEDFIGREALLDIWSSDRVERFLAVLNLTNSDREVNYIRQFCIQILSLLVTVEFAHWERFHRIVRDHKDASIPFTYQALQHESLLLGDRYDWFYRRQDSFHPVIIEEGEIREYPTSRRLPFLRSERKFLGEGSYGKVTREVVPLGQYRYKDKHTNTASTVTVARKRFQAGPDYEKEAENLKTLNKSLSSHDHIVRYLAMLVIDDGEGNFRDFNILLPCADMDLKKFLDLDLDFSTLDLVRAICGVADAIKWLHDDHQIEGRNLTCCHMDLKLDNILVYHLYDAESSKWRVGMWKISDFGISSLEEAPGHSRAVTLVGLKPPQASLKALTSNTPLTPHTLLIPTKVRSAAYQAPEGAARGGKIGRSSDVWSFGCILFQVLARGGENGKSRMVELDRLRSLEADRFTEHPTDYFYREKNGTKYLNPHVKDWLNPNGQLESFLVKECKKLIFDMLNVTNPDLRPKSKEVNKKLSDIAHGSQAQPRNEAIPHSITEEDEHIPSFGQSHAIVPSISISEPDVRVTVEESSGEEPNMTQQSSRPNPSFTRSKPRSETVTTVRNLYALAGQTPAASNQVRLGDVPRHSIPPSKAQSRKPVPSVARDTATGSSPIDRAGPSQAQCSLSADDGRPSRQMPAYPPIPSPSSSVTPRVAIPMLEHSFQPQRSFSVDDGQPSRQNPVQYAAPQIPSRKAPPVTMSNQERPYRRKSSVDAGISRASTQSSASSGSQYVSSTSSVDSDSAPFTEVRDALVALISPISGKEAFITPTKIYIRTIASPWSHSTISVKDHKWDSGSIAGDYLCVVGKDTVRKIRKILLVQLLMTDGVFDDPPRTLEVLAPPPRFGHVVVSQHGRLLFQDENCAWLYRDHLDTSKQELTVNTAQVLHNPQKFLREDLRRLWFSENGIYAIIESSSSNNLHRIRMRNVENINRGKVYDYQHDNRDATNPIRNIIPFPKSPRCILWDEHSNVIIFAPTAMTTPRPFEKVEGLQGIAVAPDEQHVILIVRRRESRFSAARCSIVLSSLLQEKNGHLSLTLPFKELGTLKHFISAPESCAIAVNDRECHEGFFNLHVLHPDGKLDYMNVNCN